MNWKFTGLIIALLFLFACKKNDPLEPNGFKEYQNEAVIVGFYEVGNCTGGYAINILPPSGQGFIVNALDLPEELSISPNSIFPIKVVLNWEKDSDYCPEANYINIKRIKRVQ